MPKQSDDMMERIRENYQSIILGFIVFLIAAVALYRALGKQETPKTAAQKEAEKQMQEVNNKMQKIEGSTYTAKKGDTLWKIAEMKYGSGYNFVDVAKANKLANYNVIEVGQKLTLPDVQPKKLTTGEVAKVQTAKVTITGAQYTVKKGDNLWTIAVGAYGDGYSWSKISKANNLKNPGLIIPGQVLKLPR